MASTSTSSLRGSITRSAHSLSTLRLRVIPTAQDSLPAVPSALTGRGWLPAAFLTEVSAHRILLSWRFGAGAPGSREGREGVFLIRTKDPESKIKSFHSSRLPVQFSPRPRLRVTRGQRVPRRSRPPNQPIQVRSGPSSLRFGQDFELQSESPVSEQELDADRQVYGPRPESSSRARTVAS
jgi:hypothetical protein